MQRFWRPALLVLALAAPVSLAVAQKKTDGKYSHPNLMAADKLCAQALAKVEAAQAASELDAERAARAKELIKQAQDELRLATKK